MPTWLKKHGRLLGNITFFALIVVFLTLYLRDFDYDQLNGIELRLEYLTVAVLSGLAFRFWGVVVWTKILENLGAERLPNFRTMASVYGKAWMGRYIPGKVVWIAGKVLFATKYGISKSRLGSSSILEAIIQIVAIYAISLVFLLLDPRFDLVTDRLKWSLVIGGAALSVLVIPRVFNWLMGVCLELLGKSSLKGEASISSNAVLTAFKQYGVGYFISGISYFFLTAAIYPIDFNSVFYVMALFNIAGALGIASIITPSGLGVREGTQLLLLVAIMPKEIALVVTALSRLFSVFVDVLFYILTQIKPKETT